MRIRLSANAEFTGAPLLRVPWNDGLYGFSFSFLVPVMTAHIRR